MSFPTAADIAAAVRSRRTTARAETAACLDRIDARQASLNAFVTVCRQEALAAADAVDAAAEPGPLAGVPFSVKDNIETRGVRTTWGSRTLESHVPTVEAVAVTRLRRAGAVMIGKTTLPEFASTVLARSPLTGTTRNPWNPALTPGGSSSGAAAAVAAGLGPIALTTDAGASTRLPAALCGVLGIKPTIGLIPYELFPDGFGNFIHMGLMARTVEDLALALDTVSGEDPRDPQSIGMAPTRAVAAVGTAASLAGERIHWRPLFGNAALDAEVRALCEAALGCLADAGATLVERSDPFEGAGTAWRTLQQMNWAGRFGLPDEAGQKLLDAGFLAGVRAAHATGGFELAQAIYRRTACFRTVQQWFGECEWLATPVFTVAGVPADAAGDTRLTINGRDAGELRTAWAPYLSLFNFSGHPAISIPAGFTAAGMPVGLQLVGRLRSDAALLQRARLIESARPWAGRMPPAPD